MDIIEIIYFNYDWGAHMIQRYLRQRHLQPQVMLNCLLNTE